VTGDESLVDEARRAAECAYAPYSGFRVGSAVLARDGRVVRAANVENASYGLTICAERAALSRAVAEGIGPGEVAVVAVTASPCGGCRQWLLEFGVDRVVFPVAGKLVAMSPAELLPQSFRLDPPGGGAVPGRARGGVVED
jgi:cytidine deaminase